MASSWQLGPVLRGIRGHRAAALLVVVQLGLGLSITVLAAVIGDYFARSFEVAPSPDTKDVLLVELQLAARSRDDMERRRAELLDEIRRTPGCVAAAVVGEPPRNALERDLDDVRRMPNGPPVRAFTLEGGASIAQVAGLRLHAGRDFTADDVRSGDVTAAIVSVPFARALWPDQDPVGARFVSRAHGPSIVVGVADDLRAHLFGGGASDVLYATVRPHSPRMPVLVRSAPGRASELRAALDEQLRGPGQHAIVTRATAHTREGASTVTSVLGILATMSAAMVLVILIGSMGLTYYLVAERTREIGLRRAMGATRRDVIRYFLVENMILTGAGAAIGLVIVALALPTLAHEQENFAVNWPLVALAVAGVVGLNLIATLIPAMKAAGVPPVVASRTV